MFFYFSAFFITSFALFTTFFSIHLSTSSLLIIDKFVNILPTNTTMAAKYISTFSLSPKYVSIIASIAFPKKPETNIYISKFFFITPTNAPKTESNAAIIATAK